MGDEIKLFVGGLPQDANEQELTELFGRYGIVTEVYLMSPSGKSGQRCAFVRSPSSDPARSLLPLRACLTPDAIE